MAVETTESRIDYSGNGEAAIAYPIPFPFHHPADIQVAITDQDGVTLKLDPALFEVHLPPGAAVVLDEAAPTTSTVAIYREVPLTQPTVYPEGGRFLAQTHEKTVDRATFQIQQLDRSVDRTFRVDELSTPLDPLVPVPNALVGYDADGQPTTYDQAYIRELVMMGGDIPGMGGNATFADATARAATVPAYVGQLGIQRDDNSQWVSTALTAGAWVRLSPGNICRTDAELKAAVLRGGDIGIIGTITLTPDPRWLPYEASIPMNGLVLDVPGTRLFSIRDATGKRAALRFPHLTGKARVVIEIRTSDCSIFGLEITTNHPLTSDTTLYNGYYMDTGIGMFGALVTDPVLLAGDANMSGFRIEDCDIHHVGVGIELTRGEGSTVAARGRITNNYIHSFCATGLNLQNEVEAVIVEGNVIEGRSLGSPFNITISAATNLITTATPHGLTAGRQVCFPNLVGGGSAGGAPLIVNKHEDYYVIAGGLSATQFKVSETLGGPEVDITADASGSACCQVRENHSTMGRFFVTGLKDPDNLFTSEAHGLKVGDSVWFNWIVGGAGIIVTTFTAEKFYYVIASGLSANTFRLSNIAGGATIVFTSDLTAGFAFTRNPYHGYGNAMKIGAKINRPSIARNICRHVDRHGIEILNETRGSGFATRVTDNVCEDCMFGISITVESTGTVIGNQIERAKNIGIELTNVGLAARANYICVGNILKDIRYSPDAATSTLGISVDEVVMSCLVANNQIGKITKKPGINGEAIGIQMWADNPNGIANIVIKNNVFTDSGNIGIYATPGGNGTFYTRYVIEGNVFHYTAEYDSIYGTIYAVWPAIVLDHVTLAVVRNNVSWYPTGPAKNFGTFVNNGFSTVYIGDSGVAPATATAAFLGSNLRIGY